MYGDRERGIPYPDDDPHDGAAQQYFDCQLHFGYTEKAPVEAQDGHLTKEKREGIEQLGDVEEKF